MIEFPSHTIKRLRHKTSESLIMGALAERSQAAQQRLLFLAFSNRAERGNKCSKQAGTTQHRCVV